MVNCCTTYSQTLLVYPLSPHSVVSWLVSLRSPVGNLSCCKDTWCWPTLSLTTTHRKSVYSAHDPWFNEQASIPVRSVSRVPNQYDTIKPTDDHYSRFRSHFAAGLYDPYATVLAALRCSVGRCEEAIGGFLSFWRGCARRGTRSVFFARGFFLNWKPSSLGRVTLLAPFRISTLSSYRIFCGWRLNTNSMSRWMEGEWLM